MMHKRIKVLHLTETMASGVLKYLQEVICAGQNDDCVEHFIIYSPNRKFTPDNLNQLFSDNVSLIEVNMQINHAILRSIVSLYKKINQIKPDIIHLHSSIAGFIGRLVALLFPQTKVYYTPHGYSFLMNNKPLMTRCMYYITEFLLTQFRGRVIACSKSEFNYAKKISLLLTPLLVENCIRPSQEKIKIINSSPEKLVIGVGRLEPQKNPLLFIKIIAELKKVDSSIQAVWVGDGSLLEECESLNRQQKLDITFTGWLSSDKTYEYLQRSKVFLQTSQWEGLPYSILEAFSNELPVVASNIDSHKDLNESGYICLIADDNTQFVTYILDLLNNKNLHYKITSKNINNLDLKYKEFAKKIYAIYNGSNEG